MKIDLGTVAIIALVVGVVLWMSGGFGMCNKPPTIQRDTVITHDTVQLPIPKIVYRDLPARIEHDTLHDTVGVPISVDVARVDTVIEHDTVSVAYYFPPVNAFDISLHLAPRPVVENIKTVTVTIHDSPSFLEKAQWGLIGAGIITVINAVKK